MNKSRPNVRPCTACEAPTRSKTNLCTTCNPRPVSKSPVCPGCNKRTMARSGVCRGCADDGVIRFGDEHALDGGHWHTKPGGIKVWIFWDEGAA